MSDKNVIFITCWRAKKLQFCIYKYYPNLKQRKHDFRL